MELCSKRRELENGARAPEAPGKGPKKFAIFFEKV